MQDRRVVRGSTVAAMVIPAGTNPEAMMMDKNASMKKAQSFKRSQVIIISGYKFKLESAVSCT